MTEGKVLPPAPEAKITLDRERTLRCDMYAMRLFKRETVSERHPEGISLLRGELGSNVNEDTVAELVWAFLAHEDPELTIDQVSKEIHPGNLADVLGRVFSLIIESMPEQPDTDGEEGEGGESDPLGAETT